ncbi:MAG: DNA methyltransferase [Candidatus Firestonebacteria bacterium]
MTRKSECKLIRNQLKYKKLYPAYLRMLYTLNREYRVKKEHSFSDLVNFKTNKEIPRHNWFFYKQGYSEKLVSELLLKEKPPKTRYVLDPFTGVGTTNLVAKSLGYRSIGLDINPVATFAAKVKTTTFSKQEINKINTMIKLFSPTKKSQIIPISPLLERSFSKIAFNKLMHIKRFFESIKDKKIASFFKLAYLSIIEDCSNRIKDGNGLKIAMNKRKIRDIYSFYINKCKVMVNDIYRLNSGKKPIIINGSILLKEHFDKIKDKKVGIVIFSPPYLNCFDYCEVYKLELWMGGFVNNYEDFKKYRTMAVRSHVNSEFNHCIQNPNAKVKLISETISCFNIWNKNIPDMIEGYFDDMTKMFKKLHFLMVKGGKCFIVIANSGYKGVLVPTDLLLADIAKMNGFKVASVIYARKIRASSQQMNELHNTYKNLIRESIVVLEKK